MLTLIRKVDECKPLPAASARSPSSSTNSTRARLSASRLASRSDLAFCVWYSLKHCFFSPSARSAPYRSSWMQGLTFVHFSAQLEPFLTQSQPPYAL